MVCSSSQMYNIAMRIFILGGQSLSNREWVLEIKESINDSFTTVDVIDYEHWKKGEGRADVDLESSRFIEKVNSLPEDYMIFAKSIGTVIFLNSLSRLKKLPTKVVMVGVPLNVAKEQGYDFEKLKEVTEFPIAIHQKKNDPFSDYENLRVLEGGMVKVNVYPCLNEPENDHHYANMETVGGIILGS